MMAESARSPLAGENFGRAIGRRLLPLAGLVAVLLAWQLVTWLWAIPNYILPQPLVLAHSFRVNAPALVPAIGVLLVEAACGFVVGSLVGVTVAFAVNRWPTVRVTVLPIAVAIRSVPLVAITPLVTLVVGIGHATVVVIAAIVVFFPTLVNVSRGLRSAPRSSLDLFKVLDASDWAVFWKLRLPAALPFLFAAFKITAPASIVAAMLAEYVASNAGLGYLIQESYVRYRYDLVWQIVVLATALTVAVYAALGVLERKVIRWRA